MSVTVEVMVPATITLPEGRYDVFATTSRAASGGSEALLRVNVEAPGGVPFPGRGCLEDRAYSEASGAASIADAVAEFGRGILEDRALRGGPGWRPRRGPAWEAFDGFVFADCDGVLNHNRLYAAMKARGPGSEPWEWLDPACVALLDAVAERGRAGVVLSSAWPIYLASFERSVEALREAGLRAQVVGACPTASARSDPPPEHNGTRAAAIAAWLGAHPGARRWVILDDCAWHGLPVERTVRTDIAVGLTRRDAERAAKILAVESPRSA